jgi:hypothetical protein
MAALAKNEEKANSLNDGFTAKPHSHQFGDIETVFETSNANELDAKLSGYTDEEGHAVDMAKPDIARPGVDGGRSSAIHFKDEGLKTEEDAPQVGDEKAP